MEKAGCKLVDTELFVNLLNTYKEWFTNVAETEEDPRNKAVYKEASQMYSDTTAIGKERIVWNNLYRYYIYKKYE